MIKSYGYCDYVFQFNDIVVTSCRYVFHPFCLGIMIKSSNKCLVCKENLHPNWWSFWGFGEQNHRLTKLAQDLDFEEERKRTIANMRDAAKVGLDAISSNL